MNEKTKRPISIVIMVLCIIASVFIGANKGLSEVTALAAAALENGVNNDGDSITKRLSEMTDGAANMITVAKRVKADENFIQSVEAAKEELKLANTPHEKYTAMTELIICSNNLLTHVQGLDASETDKNFAYTALKSIESAELRIQKIGYNEYVEMLNARFSAFPANVTKHLVNAHEAEYFR